MKNTIRALDPVAAKKDESAEYILSSRYMGRDTPIRLIISPRWLGDFKLTTGWDFDKIAFPLCTGGAHVGVSCWAYHGKR